MIYDCEKEDVEFYNIYNSTLEFNFGIMVSVDSNNYKYMDHGYKNMIN